MTEYIDREAAMNKIEDTDWYHITTHGNLVMGAADEDSALYKAKHIYEALNNVPAADVVEVRHGEWETKEVLSEPGEVQKYSHFHKECKYFYVDYGIGGHYYCPLCGAKMDGKDGAE